VGTADESFKDYVLDQLGNIEDLECRAMFGGYGLYQGDIFFGIIYKGRLYFKTDEKTTATAYKKLGMKPFRPNAKQTLKNYREVPADILEDHDQLAAWAKEAVRCNMRGHGSKDG
jgi:DNA transformation protein